ncbi:MAG: sigma 54-interacting transcriptional regulator [Candidatus Cloacimonetes bacterium]|nr:sigma 54-interacting transcriptional regulator [Candidatus Cloacimonadota bacterium]
MSDKMYQKMHLFISERFDLNRVLKLVQDQNNSHLIEVVGRSGSGKSHLVVPILRSLDKIFPECVYFSPHPLSYNHLHELVQILTGLDIDAQNKIYKEYNQKYHSGRKYDFFYYITEQFTEKNLLKPIALLIDDCDVLDSYSNSFLQYIVQYAPDAGIQIIALSQKRQFTFSIVITMPDIVAEDMQKLLAMVFPETDLSHISEGEILHSITGGNLMILEKILSELSRSIKDGKIDLSPYLEKTYDAHEVYEQNLASLNESQQELMLAAYILDGMPLSRVANALGRKSYKADANILIELGLLAAIDDNLIVQKKRDFRAWVNRKNESHNQQLIKTLFEHLLSTNENKQSIAQLAQKTGSKQLKLFTDVLDIFDLVSDSESSIAICEYLYSFSKSPEDKIRWLQCIAQRYSYLNQNDKAAEYYRQALHICAENDLPAAEIVYHLSSSLFAINSNNFALEIIKKYSPSTIDEYWRARILLLKADILGENEEFIEAFANLENVLANLSVVEDQQSRYRLQAETKKIRGKIHYYTNEWDNSQDAFKEAETLYLLAKDNNGLAAIYNNMGVLFMFQGDWSSSESYFLKSLDLEKKNYSLNGISVCYNNLGGLMDDKGDAHRSLYYLEEALKIQRLLAEPYNITNIYNNMGVTRMDHGDFEGAEEALKKSMEIAIEFNFFRNTVASHNNLGALRFKQGDWEGSIEFYEKAIKLSEENSFVEGLLRSFNNLGEIYEKSGELNLAYDLYFKGLELLPEVSDDYIKAELYGNLGSVLTKLHKFKDAYRYLVESLDFFKNLGARDKIIEGCQYQAFYFIMTHNQESADYYANEALNLARELRNDLEIGKSYFYLGLLERKNYEHAKQHFNDAIKYFLSSRDQYELSLANYELAGVLLDLKEWEKALQILKNNKKIIQRFGSIKLLEQNDILLQKVMREYSSELKEVEFEENLLNQFYEITQKLNEITDLDIIIEQALSSLIEISEADGGMLCLGGSPGNPEAWEYKFYHDFSPEDDAFETIIKLCAETCQENEVNNLKQPQISVKYNNILFLPLSIRQSCLGVVMLYCSRGSNYFSERIINLLNALANQVIVIIENIRSANLEKTHATIRKQLLEDNIYANIIGKSPEMMKIFEIVEKVKDTPTTVLLEGESGTGKELIARALHYSSNRSNKAYVAQYCGALPESLLESELFGHVKGSFTGAAYDKKGLFEVADGGTFFLDEIADISQSTQAKLLRVLQEGEIKRVGATKTEKVNVRVVCATNISLIEKVKSGEFRLDLYYRLNVIRIIVPPLRNRPGDVPLLAIHFLDKYNTRMDKNVLGFSSEAMKMLENYEFPGNVRQLENEIERAVTLVEDNTFISPADFSEEVYKHMDHSRTIDLLSSKKNLKEAVEELERKMIVACLEKNDWNQTQAAKELGLSRQGLIKKLQRYNLNRDE